jgi:hypothetical protein
MTAKVWGLLEANGPLFALAESAIPLVALAASPTKSALPK